MRLNEFRQSPTLVEDARNLFATPVWRDILDVLKQEHAHQYHRACRSETEAVMELGRIYGYDTCLATLEMCAIPQAADQAKHIDATWAESDTTSTA